MTVYDSVLFALMLQTISIYRALMS